MYIYIHSNLVITIFRMTSHLHMRPPQAHSQLTFISPDYLLPGQRMASFPLLVSDFKPVILSGISPPILQSYKMKYLMLLIILILHCLQNWKQWLLLFQCTCILLYPTVITFNFLQCTTLNIYFPSTRWSPACPDSWAETCTSAIHGQQVLL